MKTFFHTEVSETGGHSRAIHAPDGALDDSLEKPWVRDFEKPEPSPELLLDTTYSGSTDERIYRGMWIWAMIAVLLAAMLVDNQQNIMKILNLILEV